MCAGPMPVPETGGALPRHVLVIDMPCDLDGLRVLESRVDTTRHVGMKIVGKLLTVNRTLLGPSDRTPSADELSEMLSLIASRVNIRPDFMSYVTLPAITYQDWAREFRATMFIRNYTAAREPVGLSHEDWCA